MLLPPTWLTFHEDFRVRRSFRNWRAARRLGYSLDGFEKGMVGQPFRVLSSTRPFSQSEDIYCTVDIEVGKSGVLGVHIKHILEQAP